MKLKFIDEFKIGCLIKLSAFDKIGQNTIKIKGVTQTVNDPNSTDGRTTGPTPVSFTVPVNMNDNIQYWFRNNDDDGRTIYGGAQNQTQFHTRFTARYSSA